MTDGSPNPTKKRSRPSGPFHKMTSAEFRQWVADMGYPARIEKFDYEVPYNVFLIARDLGVHENRVLAYWRGADKGQTVHVSAMVTKLCMALLALRRVTEIAAKARNRWPEMDAPMQQIIKAAAKK